MFKFAKQKEPMSLIVGLGNPGAEYEGHRHNVGFMAAEEIARAYNYAPFRSKFQGMFAEGKIDGRKVGILMPKTYMNNSGQSVAAAAKFYKIAPADIIVLHDELDLEPSRVKTKIGGGNGGHNGLKSIQAHLGTAEFKRVRIGIGHPGDKDKVSDYVLSDFAKSERPWVKKLIELLARHMPLLVEGGDAKFMTKIAEEMKE